MGAVGGKNGDYTWCQLIWRATLFILTVAFYVLNIAMTAVSNIPSICKYDLVSTVAVLSQGVFTGWRDRPFTSY